MPGSAMPPNGIVLPGISAAGFCSQASSDLSFRTTSERFMASE